MNLFIQYLAEDPLFYFAWILIVAFSICVHEYAHAATALRLGDDTAARAGHLSLNPLVQMGTTSMIMLALIGIAWGSVPVSISRFRHKWAGAVVSAAGPLSNLLLSFVFALFLVLADKWTAEGGGREMMMFFRIGCLTNGLLFALNMLPVPMFDGWSVFSYFFPRMERIDPQMGQTVSLVALVLIFVTPLRDLLWGAGGLIAGLFIAFWSVLA